MVFCSWRHHSDPNSAPRGGAGQGPRGSDAFQGEPKKAQWQRMLQGAAVHRSILRRQAEPGAGLGSIDWFKGKFTGTSQISWEHLWFPVDVPFN